MSEPVTEVEVEVVEPELEEEPTMIEAPKQSKMYAEYNAYIDEIISYYRAGNDVEMDRLEGILNYLYNNTVRCPELSDEEKKLLVEKLNSFSEELNASKGRGM